MSENDSRYGRNSNQWRKVYGYNRRKPKIVAFVDSGSQQTRTINTNETYRHRDFHEIDGFNIQVVPTQSLGFQYDEGFIAFNNECIVTASFNFIFNATPIVVYTAEDTVGNDSENINVFGMSVPSTASMVVGTSAPFSGTIRYRAVNATSYPQTSPSASTSHIAAGTLDIVNSCDYTASYTLPPAGTYTYFATVHETGINDTANTATTNDTTDDTSSTNSLSAALTNKIHFMVFRS